ncbi:MAG TPA: enoyl-CoA hydratase-related protein [Acidimicrobiales bacterium]|nr:enoyl-CoA hydratase-related protein [Acidimicrobiales bacterium]
MDLRELEYDVADGVATIAFNRPDKMNTGTPRMVGELLQVLDAVDADDDVRAVILTGRGRAFCAGADLSAGAGTFDYDRHPEAGAVGGERVEGVAAPRDGAGLVTLRLFDCKKPVISAVNGAAVGMGVTMTLATDIRLAAESARFGFVFTQRGIAPEGASTWFLPRLVGVAQAAEWLYTGRVFGAEEALRGGLVRSVHPDDQLLDVARELAAEIAAAAPLSVALTRQMLWRMLGAEHPMIAHRADSRAVHATGKLPDAMEGVMSFLEKRPASFTGKVSTELPDIFPEWDPPEYR